MERNILFVNCTGTQPGSLEALKKEGFRVDMVHDSDTAIQRLNFQEYDVTILQVSPSAESWQFCRDVRRISTLPLIVISNNAGTEDCVKAINAGADFFMRKPFGPQELVARIKALLYRSNIQTRRQPIPAS